MERVRRVLTGVCAWGGWGGSIALGIWSVEDYDPNKGDFAPQWVGLAFIFLIGVAVAASSARARQKLSDQIVEAFRIGLNGSHELQREAREYDEWPEHTRPVAGTRNPRGSRHTGS